MPFIFAKGQQKIISSGKPGGEIEAFDLKQQFSGLYAEWSNGENNIEIGPVGTRKTSAINKWESSCITVPGKNTTANIQIANFLFLKSFSISE